jgi:mRNA interferase YafQ
MKLVRSTVIFNRDLKRLSKRSKNIEKLRAIISTLVNNVALPPKHRPHKLTGDHFPKWECRIEPDWLLIYEVQDDLIILYRTGTHADLF